MTAQRPPLVLCIGETMALLTPSEGPGPLRMDVHQAGAEGNVAAGLAHLGVRSRWLSRLGDDEFAPVITEFLASRGVDVAAVVDPERPTGVMLKAVRRGRTTVRYARAGSAASALSVADLGPAAVAGASLCHLSGITPALSPDCARLVDAIVVERRLGPQVTVSFDVNHRPALWPEGGAAGELRRIAGAADIVLVGLDEAADLWGCRTAAEVRAVLPRPGRLVVKDGAIAAHEFHRGPGGDRVTVVPALRAEVVEVVGAGDSFAAGYLAGLLAGDDDPALPLRLGHVLAACTLQSRLDLPDWPGPDRLWGWARSGAAQWQELHIDPSVLGPATPAPVGGPRPGPEPDPIHPNPEDHR